MKIKRWIILLMLLGGCKEKYVVKLNVPPSGYLVVEGFINISGNTSIMLTRSSSVDTPGYVPEPGAELDIQTENGPSYFLAEDFSGHYSINGLSLDPGQLYRLHIRTANGKEYVSDYSAVRITPPIDSVNWTATTDAINGQQINIFVSTHDDQSQPGYYQWQYEETWKYHSGFSSDLEYLNDTLVLRPVEDNIYYCWKSDLSNTISIANTEKLSANVIYQYPLTEVPYSTSNKLITRYSILVKQYALTREWYEWNQKIKKNTEQLGSIFDAQPSETGGNIQCVTDPGEKVIGFVGCTTETEQRIFIDRTEIPYGAVPDDYVDCLIDTVAPNKHAIDSAFQGGGNIPLDFIYFMNKVIGVQGSIAACVDCRIKGGTNVKPPFWK